LPAAMVKVFGGLGHNPFWEDPQGVAAVINRFLESPR
jgi:pimeloyl-ACP methyl ester carboxylesterase